MPCKEDGVPLSPEAVEVSLLVTGGHELVEARYREVPGLGGPGDDGPLPGVVGHGGVVVFEVRWIGPRRMANDQFKLLLSAQRWASNGRKRGRRMAAKAMAIGV